MANVIHGKLRALRNKVLVRNIDQGMRKSKGGIILTQSDANDGESEFDLRQADPDGILGYSEERPEDIQASDKSTF